MPSPSSSSPSTDESFPTVYAPAPVFSPSPVYSSSPTSHPLTSPFPLISLSRDLYKQHVHRLYRSVALHKGNAELFYREIFDPEPFAAISIAPDEELWKRLAGMVNGGREPDTRLGPHDFRPGKSLLNKLCLFWEDNHLTTVDVDAIDDTDEAADLLLDLADHIFSAITKTTTEQPAPPVQLHLFHHAVSVCYRWESIESMCESPDDRMFPKTYSSAWAGRPLVCVNPPSTPMLGRILHRSSPW
ncbi:hypothetical protein L198_00051 [Cryptococcus wingfieldii CBS 7118]|uniref:Uncharacterized protein n=1 Tax=Cryptococcus wingfieldii CBS 7118 TaxID=1295528 RepID=A0A1E3K714_9TREE|nr:hypothetical protein L198_00051 [Cryptococcus wingfieldii CBS 7118]ODO08327.1 hypothetical protein L198_00051 [Cryptococcus wingfieldii CBS 7118]